jgi:hypothetical protein
LLVSQLPFVIFANNNDYIITAFTAKVNKLLKK